MPAQNLKSVDDVLAVIGASSSPESMNLGQILFLGLDKVRERLGEDRWQKAQSLVASVVEKAIAEVCAPGDYFLRCQDDAYLMVFAHADEETARGKAAKVAQRVNASVFGERGFEGVSVHSAVQSAGSLALDSGANPTKIIEEMTERAIKDAEVAQALAQATDARSYEDVTAEAGGAGDGSAEESAEERLARRQDRRRQLMKEMTDFANEPLSFAYMPIWSAEKQRVSFFHCVPVKQSLMQSEPVRGYAILTEDSQATEIADLDLEVLEFGLLELHRALRQGVKVRTAFNVHFETIAGRYGRDQLKDLLKAVPDPMRRMITIHLGGFPAGLPAGRFQELIRIVRPFCGHVSLEFAYDQPRDVMQNELQRARGQVDFLSMTLPEIPKQAMLPIAKEVGSQAQQAGLRLGCMGVTTWRTAYELLYSGFLFVGGPVFGGPYEGLPRPFAMPASEIERLASAATAGSTS